MCVASLVVAGASTLAAIAQSLTIIAPNGGETYVAGAPITVRWSESGLQNDDELEVEYTVDGENWRRIARLNAGTGMVTWTPDRSGTSARVRVIMRRNESVGDESDGTFTITPDPLDATVVIAPNGGEVWRVGETRTISWQVPPDAVDVLIELSTNGGATWSAVATVPATSTQYAWTVPSISSQDIALAVVRVSVAEALDHFDVSDAPFTIRQQPRVTVISPNGGERFARDSATIVRWSTAGVGEDGPEVRAQYSVDAGATWTTIATEDATNGLHAWIVPDRPTKRALVRVIAVDGSIGDTSDAYFEILGDSVIDPPTRDDSIRIVTPSSGAIWIEGDYQTISWRASTADDSVAVSVLFDATDATQLGIRTVPVLNEAITWKVPRLGDTAVRVRLIARLIAADIADTSDVVTVLPRNVAGITNNSGVTMIAQVSPNPATSHIDVRVEGGPTDGIIVMYATDGSEVRSMRLERGVGRISLEGLNAGAYYVVVRGGGAQWSQRVMVF